MNLFGPNRLRSQPASIPDRRLPGRIRLPGIVLALAVLAVLGAGALRADDDTPQPPEEIPDFSNLDEYIYVPKTTLNLGGRYLFSGPKMTFAGQGYIPAPSTETPVDTTSGQADTWSVNSLGNLQATISPASANASRVFHDGSVGPNGTATSTSDGNGVNSSGPANTGQTNNWSYLNGAQVTNNTLTLASYSGEVTDTSAHDTHGESNMDVELSMVRDMGPLGKHFTWDLIAGFSLTDVRTSYWVNQSGSVSAVSATFADDNSASAGGGSFTGGSSPQTFISSTPTTLIATTAPQSASSGVFVNRYFVDGAYYTLRFGPAVTYAVNPHFKISFNVGGAIIYSGTNLEVDQFLNVQDIQAGTNGQPAGFGNPETSISEKSDSFLLPAYYMDLSAEYDFTDTAGIYVGALHEGGGSYTQTVSSGSETSFTNPSLDGTNPQSYTARVDFGNQNGLRAGMTVRF